MRFTLPNTGPERNGTQDNKHHHEEDEDEQDDNSIKAKAQSGPPTNLSVKPEQAQIPEFFSEKGRDTISAQNYTQRMDDLVGKSN